MKAKRKPGKFDPTVLAIQRTLRELEHLPSDTERDIFRQFFLARWFPMKTVGATIGAEIGRAILDEPLERHSVPSTEPLRCPHGEELANWCEQCAQENIATSGTVDDDGRATVTVTVTPAERDAIKAHAAGVLAPAGFPKVIVKGVVCKHGVLVGEKCFGCEAEAMPEKVLPGGKVAE